MILFNKVHRLFIVHILQLCESLVYRLCKFYHKRTVYSKGNTMEKYTIMLHEQRLHCLQDCPILLQSYALTKDNENDRLFLQCKFQNNAQKPIQSINIAVQCSDVFQKQLSSVENFSYEGLNIQPYTVFGDTTPVYLHDNTTRAVKIIPLKVVFTDDTMWENTSKQTYEPAEDNSEPLPPLDELASLTSVPEEQTLIPVNTNTFKNTHNNQQKYLLFGGIATALIAIIICIGIFLTIPKPLKDTTTLADGSVATFKGGYIMEVPSYSYKTRACNFDPASKVYLCFAFNTENKGSEPLSIPDTFSGEVKSNGDLLDVTPAYMSATEDDEKLTIDSGNSEDVLLILPVPKDTDLSNTKSTIQIAGKKYKFDRDFTDVRDFVRGYQDKYDEANNLLLSISTARKKLMDDGKSSQTSSNLFVQLVGMYSTLNNLYSNTRGFHSSAISVHNELSQLTVPDIPFYQDTVSKLTDYTQDMATKLECVENMQYPVNSSNVSGNIKCMGEFIDNFSAYCFDEILEAGTYFIVDFGSETE